MVNNMIRIITDDVFDECMNMLLMYTDEEYIRNRIIFSYPNLSESKQKSVSKKLNLLLIKV